MLSLSGTGHKAPSGQDEEVILASMGLHGEVVLAATGLEEEVVLSTTGLHEEVVLSSMGLHEEVVLASTGLHEEVVLANTGLHKEVVPATTGLHEEVIPATTGLHEEMVLASTEPQEEVFQAAFQVEQRDRVGVSLGLDDSLTSLQWLQDFSILGGKVPQHQQLGAPASPLAGDPASIGMPLTPGKPTAAALPSIVAVGHCPDEVDYKTNAQVKPPYSYATLICMAMQASKKTKITLSCIYKWITDNFCYYRHADPTWQNSIRHNLSLNKCFIKVPRQKDEPGKGGFWRIDPQYAERLMSGAYKKRRMPPVQINPALRGRLGLTPRSHGPAGNPLDLHTNPSSHLLSQELVAESDPHLAEGTMLGSWPVVRGRGGQKRKWSMGSRRGPRRCSSPLLCADEQKDVGPLKGDFDWDALLDSALSGELSLQEGVKEEDLTVRGTHISPIPMAQHLNPATDFEETFLATAFLETPWPGEEEQSSNDFLCTSTVALDQLFDLGTSLNGGRIDALL